MQRTQLLFNYIDFLLNKGNRFFMPKPRRFNCNYCKKTSTYNNVQCMDIVKCPFCMNELIVPENAVVVLKKDKIKIYKPKKPCEKRS